MYNEVLKTILDSKVIAILRGINKDQMEPLGEALYRGGIRCIEVTFDHKKADCIEMTTSAIAQLTQIFAGRMFVGAGTVLTPDEVEATAAAGGTFIISPNCNEAVIRKTRELGLVSIPGAMTPTEIVQADQWGASIVKVFPAGDLGPSYIKSVRAPLSHIMLCAVGGVDDQNMASFYKAGISCFGVGSNIAKKSLLEAKDYAGIEANARLYTKQSEE